MAAVTGGQLKRLKKSFATTEKLGVDASFLDKAGMSERGIPAAFIGGILEHKGGTLHPGKYLMGLKEKAVHAGVQLIENIIVSGLEKGSTYRVATGNGIYEADKIVVATNAFKPLHRYLKSKTVPLTVSLIETEPIDPEKLGQLQWPNKEGIYTAHEILESYRLSADNTIIAGSKSVTYNSGYKKNGIPNKRDLPLIKETFYKRFPELHGLNIANEWSGPISLTLDFLPVIRPLETNVYTACAYAGHGIAMATYGGRLAAEMILNKPRKNYLIERKVISIPPEPFRFLVAKILINIFRLIDWFSDRKANG